MVQSRLCEGYRVAKGFFVVRNATQAVTSFRQIRNVSQIRLLPHRGTKNQAENAELTCGVALAVIPSWPESARPESEAACT
jgi:hypothetical protein